MELHYSVTERATFAICEDFYQPGRQWHLIARQQPERKLNAFIDSYEKKFGNDKLRATQVQMLWHWFDAGFKAKEKF